MNDSEFQAALKNGVIGVMAFFTATWTVTCSDGQILRNAGASFGFDLFHELRTNPQGKVTGIELTGYNNDHPDPWNQQLKDGPGSVCYQMMYPIRWKK